MTQCTKSKIKNVIFIMLDTLQFNYLGCYGGKTVKTPNLDRFARNGVVFENAYSEGLPTVPVRRALATGRFTLPYAGWQPLKADDTTLADIMWGRMLQTALVYDTPPMRLPKFGYSRGFDYVKFCRGHELDHTPFKEVPADPGLKAENFTSPSQLYKNGKDGEFIDDASKALYEEIDCFLRLRKDWRDEDDNYISVVASEADRWLRDIRDKDKPFFLWMDSFDPHEPWDAPSMFEGKPCPYDPDYKGNPMLLALWTPVEGRISDEECNHVRALYAETIELVDKRIGKLMDSVREQGLWDETMIVITSDHGQPMGKGEHGHGLMRKCRPWPYEELVHVPLLMHIPGVEGGKRVKGFVQNADIAPTILDALDMLGEDKGVDGGYGFPVYTSVDMHGQSLLPLARGEKDKIRDFAIAGYFGMSWSIITEDYSFIHWLSSDADNLNQTQYVRLSEEIMKDEMWTCTAGAKVEVPEDDELYDRRSDPFQLKNLIKDKPQKAEELLQQLKLFIGELRTS